MRPGIWQEFDGYEAIASEIEVSRRINPAYQAEREAIAQYIDRLHPKELRLRVADIITETDSAKTFRLVAAQGYLPPFQAGRMVEYAGVIREATEKRIATWPSDRPFPLHHETQALTLEVILRAVFGVEDQAELDTLAGRITTLFESLASPFTLLAGNCLWDFRIARPSSSSSS